MAVLTVGRWWMVTNSDLKRNFHDNYNIENDLGITIHQTYILMRKASERAEHRRIWNFRAMARNGINQDHDGNAKQVRKLWV